MNGLHIVSGMDKDRVRLITTGHDAAGRSIVAKDEIVTRDQGALRLWCADTAPIVKSETQPPIAEWWPPPGGVRVMLSTRAPKAAPKDTAPKAWPDINDVGGFHASASTDVVIMISGRIWLELDDGVEVELKAGDVLVQNGTRHRWHNHGDEWPLMAILIVGARDAP